jgi:hypothetical protein
MVDVVPMNANINAYAPREQGSAHKSPCFCEICVPVWADLDRLPIQVEPPAEETEEDTVPVNRLTGRRAPVLTRRF